MVYSSQFTFLFRHNYLLQYHGTSHCYTPAFAVCSLLLSELELHLCTMHDSHIQAFPSRHLYLYEDHYSSVILQKLRNNLLDLLYFFMSLHVYRLYNLIILINVVRLVIGSYMYILQLFLELLFSSSTSF